MSRDIKVSVNITVLVSIGPLGRSSCEVNIYGDGEVTGVASLCIMNYKIT